MNIVAPRSVERTLILSFVAVVLSFVGATLYGEYRTGEIKEAALSIQGNAAPSIQRLASARAELRRFQLLVHRALDDGATPARVLEIQAGRALLDEEIAAYRQLPMYSRESAIWPTVEGALSQMNGAVGAILQAMSQHDLSAARLNQEHLDDASERVASSLSDAIDTNVAEASSLAAGIRSARRQGMAWAIALDSAGVLLAAFAAALALRVSRAYARAVNALRDAAERKAAELDVFATRMAHDVRSPLAAAKLSFDAIERQAPPDDKLHRAVARGQRAVTQTVKIVDGLLEFARAGAHPQHDAHASVIDVAEEVAAVMKPKAEQIGADLVVRGDSHVTVGCSEGMLASAIANLVGNALTYVDQAPVRTVVIEIADEGTEVKTTVSDTGPGLQPNLDPQSVFEPYVRGPAPRGRGLGLGLATVKRIVDAHGGHIGVRSSSKGCTFWFTLPVVLGERAVTSAANPAHHSGESPSSRSRLTV
jgi:signal transduction histidine kinase